MRMGMDVNAAYILYKSAASTSIPTLILILKIKNKKGGGGGGWEEIWVQEM